MNNNAEGYVFLGFGEIYIRECIKLIETIKVYDKRRPICLMTSVKDKNRYKNNKIFDYIISPKEIDILDQNKHNSFCVRPRIHLIKYTPFQKTLLLDSDMICINNTNYVWDFLTSFDTPFLCLGNENEKGWHWNNIDTIQENLKLNLQAIHGGILYFDKKNKNINKFYKDCKFALNNYDKLGFLRNFRNGMTDEIIFSWAMAKNNLKAINYLEFPIISFNINANIVFPFFGHCRESIDFKKIVKTKIPCCFIHYFIHEKSNSIKTNFKLNNWYKKIYKDITSKKNLVIVTSIFKRNLSYKTDLNKIRRLIRLPITLFIFCSKEIYDELGGHKIQRVKKIYFIFIQNIDNVGANLDLFKKSFNSFSEHTQNNNFQLTRIEAINYTHYLIESKKYLWIDSNQINKKNFLIILKIYLQTLFNLNFINLRKKYISQNKYLIYEEN